MTADLIVRSDTMQPIPAPAAEAVAATPEVASSSSVLLDQVQVDGGKSSPITDVMNGSTRRRSRSCTGSTG